MIWAGRIEVVGGCCPRNSHPSVRTIRGELSDPTRLGGTFLSKRSLRTHTILYSHKRGLSISLAYVGKFVPHGRYTVKVRSGAIHSVTVVSHIGGPISFIVAKFSRGRENRAFTLLDHHGLRRRYTTGCASELVPNSVVSTHIARLRPFNTFYSVNTNVSTLVPVSNVSISHVPRPYIHFSIGRSVGTIIGSVSRGNEVALSRGRLLNA